MFDGISMQLFLLFTINYLHLRTCGILTVLTSEFRKVSDFSHYVIFKLIWRICDLTEGMYDKTSIAFNLCHHKNFLHSILI